MSKKMINIPQHLQSKFANAEESEPGAHTVDIFYANKVICGVKVVNRCVALIHHEIKLSTEDITNIKIGFNLVHPN